MLRQMALAISKEAFFVHELTNVKLENYKSSLKQDRFEVSGL